MRSVHLCKSTERHACLLASTTMTTCGIVVALLVGCGSQNEFELDKQAESIEGVWEIVSVERDGRPDHSQVFARLTFVGVQVIFHPNGVNDEDYPNEVEDEDYPAVGYGV